jgi:thioredoxin-related protein
MKLLIIKAKPPWKCPWCDKLTKEIDNSDLDKWSKERDIYIEYLLIKKGTEELKKKYKIKSVPFLVLLGDDEILSSTEYLDKGISEYKNWINNTLEEKKELENMFD